MNSTQRLVPALCSVTFRSMSAEELVVMASRNGVEAIEWGADVHVPAGDLQRAREVAEHCRQHDITAASYGSYVRAGDADARPAFELALASANALGAGNIRVWAGRHNASQYDAEACAGIANELASMADMAYEQGISVSVEFHRNTLTERVEDAVTLLQQAAHKNLFSYWQPVPGRRTEERLQEISALTPWLGHLHVFHWLPANERDERRPLAEGVDLWKPVMSAWQTSPAWPHERLAMLEFVANDAPEQFVEDMAILRQLCREADTSANHKGHTTEQHQ